MIWAILAILGVPIWLVAGALGGALWSRWAFAGHSDVFRVKTTQPNNPWPRRSA